jgi:ABC-type uncharacterized transport system substrate-binding protein
MGQRAKGKKQEKTYEKDRHLSCAMRYAPCALRVRPGAAAGKGPPGRRFSSRQCVFNSSPGRGVSTGATRARVCRETELTLEARYAEGKVERLAGLAAELVRFQVDVIVVGSTPGAMAAKNATGAIPIVIVTTGDPVAGGLVASLARPGGNITGLTALGQELGGKRLELLKEAVPKVSGVAVLSNPANPDSGLSLKGVEVAARALGVQLRIHEVRDPTEFEKAFEAITPRGSQGAHGTAGPDVR